jgi:hypothetical protein
LRLKPSPSNLAVPFLFGYSSCDVVDDVSTYLPFDKSGNRALDRTNGNVDIWKGGDLEDA